jgi:ApaG protein
MSTAVTHGVRVSVESQYLADESSPTAEHFVFAYTVTIANEGHGVVQLKTRHWIITDGRGHVEEVKGPGVVGAQPVLKPGQAFRYTSGCVLKTPRGTMHGTYQMHREDGSQFDAEIAPFLLVAPTPTAKRYLN